MIPTGLDIEAATRLFDRDTIPWHEAGHAVTAHAFGLPIDHVTINPAAGSIGRCRPSQPWPVKEGLLVLAAGAVAVQHRWPTVARELVAAGAHQDFTAIDQAITGRPDLMAPLLATTALVVADLWPEITAVASALRRAGTLTGQDITRVLRRLPAAETLPDAAGRGRMNGVGVALAER